MVALHGYFVRGFPNLGGTDTTKKASTMEGDVDLSAGFVQIFIELARVIV